MSQVHASEQAEEIEVLQSIFPSEFVLESTEAPWRFHVDLQADDNDDNNHVSVTMTVVFPDDYPDVKPDLEIISKKGLSKTQVDELTVIIQKIAEDNIGMPCIFVIAEAVKEWLQDNNVAGQDGSMYADMIRRMQQKDVENKKKSEQAAIIAAANAEQFETGESVDKDEEERLRRRQAGTQVTIETFLQWKEKFDEEQRLLVLNSGKEVVKDDRPTGKQIFLMKLAGSTATGEVDEEIDEEGEEILDFGDAKDYEGLLDDEDDSDYDPSEPYEEDEGEEEDDDEES